jgi:hypothetical protein
MIHREKLGGKKKTGHKKDKSVASNESSDESADIPRDAKPKDDKTVGHGKV